MIVAAAVSGWVGGDGDRDADRERSGRGCGQRGDS
jgi:hypothetical protein